MFGSATTCMRAFYGHTCSVWYVYSCSVWLCVHEVLGCICAPVVYGSVGMWCMIGVHMLCVIRTCVCSRVLCMLISLCMPCWKC